LNAAFAIKLDRLKSRLISAGHQMYTPRIVLTSSILVSIETAHVAFTLEALNDLQVKASYMQSAYLTAPFAKMIHNHFVTRI